MSSDQTSRKPDKRYVEEFESFGEVISVSLNRINVKITTIIFLYHYRTGGCREINFFHRPVGCELLQGN